MLKLANRSRQRTHKCLNCSSTGGLNTGLPESLKPVKIPCVLLDPSCKHLYKLSNRFHAQLCLNPQPLNIDGIVENINNISFVDGYVAGKGAVSQLGISLGKFQ
jgi:hypothetical protein